jgi:hypothetical protein
MSYETWANISTRQDPQTYTSPAELQRLERVAVGRICRCGECVCCNELREHTRQHAKHLLTILEETYK